MISNIWTIQKNSEDPVAARDLNLYGFSINLVNQGPSVLRFREELSQDEDTTFAFGDSIKLIKDGTTIFAGKIYERPRRASANSEVADYTVIDAWRDLERCVYQQTWKSTNGTTSDLIDVLKTRAVLGQGDDGNAQSTAATIAQTIDYAIARGVAIQRGSTIENQIVPFDEIIDRTVSETVIRMLRWTPDAVTYFDYSTSPPTLHIRRRSAGTSRTLTIDGTTVTANDIIPLDSLQVPAVVIKYESTHTADDAEWTTVSTDIAPVSATGLELGALVMTIELSGSRKSTNKYKIETDEISQDLLSWWESKLPWIAEGTDVSIANAEVNPVDTEDGTERGNELVSGSLPPDQEDDAEPQIVSCEISGTFGDEIFIDKKISIELMGTDLTSRTITKTVSFTAAEAIPSGLADHIYSALSILQYKGTVATVQDEIDTTIKMGDLINLDGAGAHADWEDIDAQIQAITYDLQNGLTTYQLGPAGSLSATDHIALMRANRARQPSQSSSQRLTGKPPASAVAEAGTRAPKLFNTTTPGGSGGTPAPYKIQIRENPASPGTYQAKIIANSLLFTDIAGTKLTITDRDTWLSVPGSGTPDVYLEGAVGTWPAISSATVKIGTLPAGGPVEHDNASPPVQTFFRRIIGTIDADVTPPVLSEQHVNAHLTIHNRVETGLDSAGGNSRILPVVFPEQT